MKRMPATFVLFLAANMLMFHVPRAFAAAQGHDAFKFSAHPRLKHVVPNAPDVADNTVAINNSTLISRAKQVLAHPCDIPSLEGQWIFYYGCPKHNCSLALKNGKHVCPRCGQEYEDERTRLAYVSIRYNQIDDDLLTLAKAWHITRRSEFAAEVYRVLERYAAIYPNLERHDRWGMRGALAVTGGKRFCQSLDEAIGIIKLAKAYDLVCDSGIIDDATRSFIEQNLFLDAIESIYRFYPLYDGRNNHMTWYNAAAAVVGAVLGQADLLNKAINGAKGLRYQLSECVSIEGLWCEGTFAYHYYALDAIVETIQAALACGLDLTDIQALRKLFLLPLSLAYPNGQLPAFNDGDIAFLGQFRRFYQFGAETWDDQHLDVFARTEKLPQVGSAAYEDAGLAYLRRGRDENAVAAVLDFGRHGGHHGHPDKLNLMLYALGREIFPDPGRLTYHCPEHETWTRQTVAHNTVVINQQSQLPTAGTLLRFAVGEHFDTAVVESLGAYRGVTLRRALALFDNALVDILHVQCDNEVAIDWALHGQAQLTTSQSLQPRNEPIHVAAGYQHLTELKQGELREDFHADWRLEDARFLRTRLLSGDKTEVFTGNGIGYELNSKVPFLMLRGKAKKTFHVALHDLSGNAGSIREARCFTHEGDVCVAARIDDVPWVVRWNVNGDGKRLEIENSDVK